MEIKVEGIFGDPFEKEETWCNCHPSNGETCRRKQYKLLLCLVDPHGGWGEPTPNKRAERSQPFTTKVVLLSRKKLNVRLVMAHIYNTYMEVLCSALRSYSQCLRRHELVVEYELWTLPHRPVVQ